MDLYCTIKKAHYKHTVVNLHTITSKKDFQDLHNIIVNYQKILSAVVTSMYL